MQVSSSPFTGKADPQWRIGIVASSFYAQEMDALIAGARETLLAAGIAEKNVSLHPVPGSFEVPLVGAVLAQQQKVDALIGLGIIVEGETHHANLLARESARGIMDTQLRYHIPFAFEILYVHSLKDAQARSSGEANKGKEAANAVLWTLSSLREM